MAALVPPASKIPRVDLAGDVMLRRESLENAKPDRAVTGFPLLQWQCIGFCRFLPVSHSGAGQGCAAGQGQGVLGAWQDSDSAQPGETFLQKQLKGEGRSNTCYFL